MPIPVLLIGIGIAAGVVGTGGVIHGGYSRFKAKKTLKEAEKRNLINTENLQRVSEITCSTMDMLGTNELHVLSDFAIFSDLFKQIKNRPEFSKIDKFDISLPEISLKELNKISTGASFLIGSLGGSALGTAAGMAAAGATKATIVTFGKASTGIAIGSLKGVAASNATLAALGGGSIASGGGGIALGTTVLGVSSLGIAILIGGAIFGATGLKQNDKAEEIWLQMLENEREIIVISDYLISLQKEADSYNDILSKLYKLYRQQIELMQAIIDNHPGNISWEDLNDDERIIIENTILVVGVLYNMCKVQLVIESQDNDTNSINKVDIDNAKLEAESIIQRME